MADNIADFKTGEEITEYLLSEGLPGGMAFKTKRIGNYLYLPEIDAMLSPVVQQIQDKSLGIGFYIKSKKYDKQIYEHCAGIGKDHRTAVDVALSSFLSACMDGLQKVTVKKDPIQIQTVFAKRKHNWNVYLSNVACMDMEKKKSNNNSAFIYWELLKDDIIKRLGNQRLAAVKIYAAKNQKEAIVEVRIDDVPIPELSSKVREIAEKWNPKQFISEKQFIFIEQSEDTYIPSQYDGVEGWNKLRGLVVDYLKMFQAAETEEQFKMLPYVAMKSMDDAVLAAECYSFLPEIAAIHALGDKVVIPDMAVFKLPDGSEQELSLFRLTDYYKLDTALGDIIRKGDFGEETNNLWMDLIGSSSICSAVDRAIQGGSQIENLQMTEMIYNMGEGFEIR